MEKRGIRGTKIISSFLSLAILGILIIAGPAQAFFFIIALSDNEADKGEMISFIVSINIESPDRLPVNNLSLELKGPISKTCTFTPSGNPIEGCSNMIINKISTTIFTQGNLTGNYSNIIYNWGYGYGYGYGYSYNFPNQFLSYNITLNTSILEYGEYKTFFKAIIGSDIFSQRGENLIIMKEAINSGSDIPRIWMCDERLITDDSINSGRTSNSGERLIERINNYAFEGEQLSWKVLVMDGNGIENIKDVYATVNGDIETNCRKVPGPTQIPAECGARINEKSLTGTFFNKRTQAFYQCKLTVETSYSMYGKSNIIIKAQDKEGHIISIDEKESWFLNPVVGLKIDGNLTFWNITSGVLQYSRTIILQNDADPDSGVILDMFISGSDFYDSSSSGARCPNTNKLALNNFRYFAANGAYSTLNDSEIGLRGLGTLDDRRKNSEGYINIGYGNKFSPRFFYNGYEIIQAAPNGPYWNANLLAIGAEMSITVNLNLPEPCRGNFDIGKIYLWAEAV